MANERILLDPQILEPPTSDSAEAWAGYWTKIVSWSTDSRICIGEASSILAYESFNLLGICESATASHPPHTIVDRRRVLSRILGRVSKSDGPVRLGGLAPRHTGNAGVVSALHADAQFCCTGDDAPQGIATSASHWSGPTISVQFLPPPPDLIPLVIEPRGEVVLEPRVLARSRLEGRRLRIVGGKKEDRVVNRLVENFGFTEVEWVPSEKRKSPPLDRWNNLTADDVPVCLVGAIGHAGSIKARAKVESCGLVLLTPRLPRDIEETLLERFGGAE